jgi:hypothetical protein
MAARRQVEDQAMFGFITQQARAVSTPRRQVVPIDAFRNASRSKTGARYALGVALVALGERVAGEMPAPRPAAEHDCV